jgi:O-antigen ligase
MHASMVKPQDAAIVSVLAVVLALGLTLTTPMVGVQVVLGFLIVLVAFTSVPASLFLLIFSMLLSPEITIGRVEGRGVGERALSLRVDDLLLVIIGFSWLVKTIIYRDLALIRDTPINRPIVYYMLACVLATLIGVIAGRVRPLTGFFFILKYFEYFFVFFMVVNHVSSKRQVVSLVTALLVVCFLISMYAIAQIPSGQRASAPFEGESGEPNTLGGYLVFIMAIVMGLFLHLKSAPIRVVLGLLMGFISLALMATLSRSSYLAAGVLILAIAATQWRRPGVVAFILLLAIALPFVAPDNVKNRVSETFFGRQYGGEITVGRVGLDLSTTERLRSWQYVLKDWLHSPVLGRGVTGYAWADAQYVKILGETGLVGLVAFIFLIVRLWRRARETFLAEQDPFCKGLAHGLLLGIVAMLAHGIGANTFIIIRIMEPFWLCAGLVLILRRLTSEQKNPAAQRALV